MRALVLIGLLALAGCGPSPVERAEGDYNFMKKNGANSLELCHAAQRVADEYLKVRDDEQFKTWKMTATSDCMEHDLGLGGASAADQARAAEQAAQSVEQATTMAANAVDPPDDQ